VALAGILLCRDWYPRHPACPVDACRSFVRPRLPPTPASGVEPSSMPCAVRPPSAGCNLSVGCQRNCRVGVRLHGHAAMARGRRGRWCHQPRAPGWTSV